MKTDIKWAALFAAVCAVCAAVLLSRGAADGGRAVIRVDGEVYSVVELDADEPYEFDIRTERGYNRLRVEKGCVSVTEADCPDKLCVKRGKAHPGDLPLVCLPHRLTVEVGRADVDAVAGGM